MVRVQEANAVSFSTAMSLLSSFARTGGALPSLSAVRGPAAVVGIAVALEYRGSRSDIYNILWAVVFGFATLNILSLAAKKLEPRRRGMSFGEMMAVMVVLVSVLLLGWEMLNLFHLLPLKLRR